MSKSDEFLALGKKEVADILGRDELYVLSEEQVRFLHHCAVSCLHRVPTRTGKNGKVREF